MIVRFIIALHLQKLFFHTFSNNFQATRCSFSGKLASDPESTVHISGCPEEETFDIVLMSKKVKWSSQTYFVIVLNYIFLQNLMIFLQTNLQFNSYRVDNAGKTIVWIIVSLYDSGAIKVDKNSTFTDGHVYAHEVLVMTIFDPDPCL